jgi:lipopolysaccharide/colanic/teichoic acid biosynthesis glycosyltransferase
MLSGTLIAQSPAQMPQLGRLKIPMQNMASMQSGVVSVPTINVHSLVNRLSLEIDAMRQRSPQTISERAVATLLLILLAPLMLMVAAVIRVTSRGPILYSQERVGYQGRTFHIYKFRTMIPDAEQQTGPTLSWCGDPRVTRIGRILRASHLDEFPQLINIIRGEMSFFGPRPERPVFTEQFQREFPLYRVRERVLPGITGLAQVLAPYDALPQEKLILDMKYIRDQSVALRMKILWLTLLALVGMRRQWRVADVGNLQAVLEIASNDFLRGVVTHGDPIMAD